MSKGRVLAALSGGVDSSVAALLLQEQGYEVFGVFLRNGVEAPPRADRPKQGCCSVEDSLDAARVADLLGIPFHALDMAKEFRSVRDYFRREYHAGRTPNPCAVCNRDIKFGALAAFADAIGAAYLATGHYARLEQSAAGPVLRRGRDPRKDQSYVLFPVHPEILERTLLPLGDLEKSRTRALAEQAGLPVFGKPDSQEICFVPSGDYRDVLRSSGGLGRKGRLIDTTGKVLAHHDGHMAFTRGQRRGLGFASTQPMYVLDIDPDSGDVLVGPRQATGCRRLIAAEFRTFGLELTPGEEWSEVQVQFRSSPGGQAGSLRALDQNRVEVLFSEPAQSVNPGQGLAVYQQDRMLGGGWICEVEAIDPLAV